MGATMKVVLTMNVKGVGKRGEIKEVATGFWQNFLQPKRLAVLPNAPEASKIAAQLQAKKENMDIDLLRIKELAEQLDGTAIEISTRTSGKKLFGAIREAEVAEKLGIDKNLIKMEPIKTIGSHKVKLQLPHNTKIFITVEVKAS